MQLRKLTLDDAGMSDPAATQRKKERADEIAAIRVCLREHKYLVGNHDGDQDLKSITGEILTPGLKLFTETSEKNLKAFLESKVPNSKQPYNHQTIFVTLEEEKEANKIENLTKAELRKKIFVELENLNEINRELYEEMFNKEIHNKNKGDYVQFLRKIQDIASSDGICTSHDSDNDGYDYEE